MIAQGGLWEGVSGFQKFKCKELEIDYKSEKGSKHREGSWEVFMCKVLFHEKTFKNCPKATDKSSRFLVVCLRFPKEPGMYQLGTVSLGAGSRMDLVPVWWGGEGEKGTLLSKSSPQYPGGCPGSLQSQPGVL